MGRIVGFFSETARELKKTSWPTKKDLVRSSLVVLAGTVFIGAYVAVVDFSLFQVASLLLDMVR
ncbi:MAG: preprotein translocase subunit SecE [Puniceicoccales bacterium]|jgi:preprotein translocase subunit SecE|nr:preprotein translocase subunit SecE [Puniceicoccales bacterium]